MKKMVLFIWLLYSCAGDETPVALSPQDFSAQLKLHPDAILIDVRSPEEESTTGLPKALRIPFTNDFFYRINSLEKNKPIFIYCTDGKRSARAANILAIRKFHHVYLLDRGLNAWKNKP